MLLRLLALRRHTSRSGLALNPDEAPGPRKATRQTAMARKEWARIRCVSAGARYGGEMPASPGNRAQTKGASIEALLVFNPATTQEQ